MRVLIIHTTYKLRGGEDSVVENEMELLRSNGVEVDLLQFSNNGKTLLKVLQLPFNYSSYVTTKERILSFKPDIVHIHNLHFGGSPSVVYAIRNLKVPFVFTLHNYRLLCPSATLFFNGKMFLDCQNNLFSLKAILKGVYQNSKALTFWVECSQLLHQLIGTWSLPNKYIALGQNTKDVFANSKLKSIVKNIIIKPNFCFNKSKSEGSAGKYYLYVGRLSVEKGVGLLLKTFSENKLPLKIAGTGILEQTVIEHCKEFPNIQYIGSIKPNEVFGLLADATALIFPSQWFETFGMVIIEAFSTGTPVIASDLGELKFIIKNGYNGLHFETGNADDLKEKINTFESLPLSERLMYKSNALKTYKEKYSPEINAKQLINIYEGVINEEKAPSLAFG